MIELSLATSSVTSSVALLLFTINDFNILSFICDTVTIKIVVNYVVESIRLSQLTHMPACFLHSFVNQDVSAFDSSFAKVTTKNVTYKGHYLYGGKQRMYDALIATNAIREEAAIVLGQELMTSRTLLSGALASHENTIAILATQSNRMFQLLQEYQSCLEILHSDEQALRATLMQRVVGDSDNSSEDAVVVPHALLPSPEDFPLLKPKSVPSFKVSRLNDDSVTNWPDVIYEVAQEKCDMLGELQESWFDRVDMHYDCLESLQLGFLEHYQQIVYFVTKLTDSVESLKAAFLIAGVGFSQELADISVDIPPPPPLDSLSPYHIEATVVSLPNSKILPAKPRHLSLRRSQA